MEYFKDHSGMTIKGSDGLPTTKGRLFDDFLNHAFLILTRNHKLFFLLALNDCCM